MKLRNDVMRNILMYIEENTVSPYDKISVDKICDEYGYDRNECIYHCEKLEEGGFFSKECFHSDCLSIYKIPTLSFKGHEFYEALKNESVFNRIKEEGLSMSFEVMAEISKELLAKLIKSKFGL